MIVVTMITYTQADVIMRRNLSEGVSTMRGNRYSIFAANLMLAATLLLVPMLQQAKAQGDAGADGAGVGVQKARTIVIFKNTKSGVIEKQLIEIQKNWDTGYKLVIPNSEPRINKAIVNLARVWPRAAADQIELISSGRYSKTALRKQITARIRDIEREEASRRRAAADEQAKGFNANPALIDLLLMDAARRHVHAHLYRELLKALK